MSHIKLLVGITFSVASLVSFSSTRMDRSKLLIGAYCLQNNAKTESHIKDIRDCNVDFIVGTGRNGVYADDIATLDLFAKYGLGAIVEGAGPFWNGWDGRHAGKMHEMRPISECEELVKKFKDHPAIWGINIGDEPSALDFPHFRKIVQFYNKALPGMPIYMNLYPNYASVSENTGAEKVNQLGTPTYKEHIEAYCRNVPLDYISYDFYPYMKSSSYTDVFLSKMYDNFIVVADACRRTNRSLWYIPQVNSRDGLPPTSENRLRFQANAALAFGAETIMWGCWCKGWWTNNVLNASGQKTEQYEKLQRVNAELKCIGPDYMKFRNVATHFIGFPKNSPRNPKEAYSRKEMLNGESFTDLRPMDNLPILVGEMLPRDSSNRKRALFVTAADDPSDEKTLMREIAYKVREGWRVRVLWGKGEVPVNKTNEGLYSFKLPSSAGALIIFEL